MRENHTVLWEIKEKYCVPKSVAKTGQPYIHASIFPPETLDTPTLQKSKHLLIISYHSFAYAIKKSKN